MNDLYLIGNGFDLAHGLKTSYNDFLLWYLKDSLSKVDHDVHFEDALIKIDRKDRIDFSSFNSISVLLKNAESISTVITYEHDFFKKIVKNYRDYKWVDIEYEYYMALVDLYKRLENEGLLNYDLIEGKLRSLNYCFNLIKVKLEEYLNTIGAYCIENEMIDNLLFGETGTPEIQENIFFDKRESDRNEKLFVCFNYTRTLERYLISTCYKDKLVYVHGELNNRANPIIFGYGDEFDSHYDRIKELNNREFLKNIKPLSFVTDNYQRVIRFADSGEFTVKILGHSCGLSDRYLLNHLFEHDNCKSIKIYHYENGSYENDYLEKRQEISRHFKYSKNGNMMMKIVPFDKDSKMPQNPKD